MSRKAFEDLSATKKWQITELKCLATPPQSVKDVCIAMNIILCGDDIQNKTWYACQLTLANFHRLLSTFDVDHVDPEQKRIAGELIQGLSEERVKQSSSAAVAIFKFVRAMCHE